MTDGRTHGDRGRAGPAGNTRPHPAQRGASAHPTLLLVDDSPVVHAVVRERFESRGFRVEAASSAEDALAMLDDVAPDVIVADVLMPGMDGFAFRERVRATPGSAGAAFVLLTAGDGPPHALRETAGVADDWIAKPFEADELHARVERLLEQAAPAATPREEVLAGSLDHLSLADLLQVLSMNRRDGVVIVERGEARGRIVLAGGGLVHAECGTVVGAKALHRLLRWTEARFRVVAPGGAGTEDRVTLREPTARLILDGVMARDEWNRFRDRLPDLDTRLEVDRGLRESPAGNTLAPAEAEVVARVARGERVGEILDRSPRPDGELAAAVCRCLELGVLRARG